VAYPYRVAVQISMYPMDVRHARHLLAHQLRVWGPMVDRFVVTIDVHRSRAGRYRGAGFDENLAALRAIVDELRAQDPRVSWHEVDYRPETRREVARTYFGRDDIPVKAWDGGPFYAYFHGLLEARARYVIHFDGDMLFGAGAGAGSGSGKRCACWTAIPTCCSRARCRGRPGRMGGSSAMGKAPNAWTGRSWGWPTGSSMPAPACS